MLLCHLATVFNIPTRNFYLEQSKFNIDASHLTYIGQWDCQWGDWRLPSCLLQCLCLSAQSAETPQITYRTQTERDNLLFTSMIDLLFSLLLSMIGSKKISFFRWFKNFVFMAECCANSGVFLSSKISAHPRQDLYDSKQYRFCPHAPPGAKIWFQWFF